MNKFLLTLCAAAAMLPASVNAQVAKVPAFAKTQATPLAAAAKALEIPYLVAANCDESVNPANYYIVLSDQSDATYDKNTGSVSISTGYLLCLDLYNNLTSPLALPAGIYVPGGDLNGTGPGTYNPDYTYLLYYQNGTETGALSLDGAITVTADNGEYDITCTVKQGASSRDLHFSGRLPIVSTGVKESEYAQIKHDVEVDMKGGIAFYQGLTEYSNNGVTYINLYSTDFDENGALLKDGFNLAMMVAHKRVITKNKFQLFPGTYTNAYTLDRFTWYPCREINYSFGGSIITTQFGSYIRELKSNTADRYTYGYLATGTFEFEEVGDGIYKGYLDAVTDLGYKVKVNFEGPIALNTDNANVGSTPLSWLEDDVQLDFSKLEKGRVYHRGLMGGCRDLTVDLGSPSGKDEAINYGGDLLRLEFLAPVNDVVLQPGVYTVVPRRWNDYELAAGGTYEPMSLNQHRFGGNSGYDMDGTRYCHFEEGRYCVYDLWGPVFEGQVRVETEDYVNYYMEIELVDDAGFEITGEWDGPLELQYDLEALKAGVEMIDADEFQVVVEPGQILVLNCGNSPVELFSTTGALVARGNAATALDTSGIASGVYILKVNNHSVKVIL